jgi:leucyl-tRNA synthetase
VPPLADGAIDRESLDDESLALARKANETIVNVSREIGRFHFNKALSWMMELVNDLYRLGRADDRVRSFAAATVASVLFPFAPHLGAEVYERVTGRRVWEDPWPTADPTFLEREVIKMVVQVNGKVRDSIEVPVGTADDEIKRAALERPNVQRHLDGKRIEREVVVPGRLVNFVIR